MIWGAKEPTVIYGAESGHAPRMIVWQNSVVDRRPGERQMLAELRTDCW
jgi:hypothetical protein